MKYLDLPLAIRRLKKIDFQPLYDKAAGKMLNWQGQNLTMAGRMSLTKFVLISQPVYLLTALKTTGSASGHRQNKEAISLGR